MILDTTIIIEFDCLVPQGKICLGDDGAYHFEQKPKFRKRKFDFAALEQFLKIPRLATVPLHEVDFDLLKSSRGPYRPNKTLVRRHLEARENARQDFYRSYGFLTNNHKNKSETEAEFDAIHISLCRLDELRTRGELVETSDNLFLPPSASTWKILDYGSGSIPAPIYQPQSLASALYLTWFFGPRHTANFKTCKMHTEFGPRVGCQVYFEARANKHFCSTACRVAHNEKINPNRKKKKEK